jgi:putative transposase
MIRKTYKYRLYPTRAQVALLEGQLSEACRLYNAALQERRDAWRINRLSLSYYDQCKQLKEIRISDDLTLANYGACQDVLMRVDRSFKAFFTRVKRGERAGFPRFKSASRFDSFTYPVYGNGCKLQEDSKLRLQGIGHIKVKLHRPVEGKIKTTAIKREAGRWYVCFSVECEAQPLPTCDNSIGVDVGLSTFATLSDGTEIENPRYHKESQAKLRRAQRKVSRRKKGSNRRRKAIQLLQCLHAHIRNQRADFHHKLSRQLVNQYGLIAIEDLNIKGLASGMLAKSVNDAGWSAFINKLMYKAEEAGRVLMKVDPRGTSQRCVCGASVPKTLKQRWHSCHACGLSVGRDYASALEILRLGLEPSKYNVSR